MAPLNHKRFLSSPLGRTTVRIALEEMQTWLAKEKDNLEEKIPPLDTEGLICEFYNPYINRSGVPLIMDWIRPADTGDRELPVVVLIHGGMLVMDDQTTARRLGASIARRGYLVAIINYRLIPATDIPGQLDDVCAGLDYVGRKLVDYEVDFQHIYLIAESAGAFLSTYVSAMQSSRKLQDTIGYRPSKLRFKAMGLISGMFYTTEDDILGNLMAGQFYGDKITNADFMQYMNPNHPEIMNSMIPTFLITSKGDFLNR